MSMTFTVPNFIRLMERIVRCLHKTKHKYNLQQPSTFVSLDFYKNSLIKRFHSCEEPSAYKFMWRHVDWCKICVNLKRLSVPNF
jgi:hypothetical protein